MRTSNTLSQQEINDFTDFCISRGIQMQGEVGVKNGEEISQIISNSSGLSALPLDKFRRMS